MKLIGKKALVTGASRGIGREIALELARQGADVAINFAGSEAKANEVVDEVKALGREAFAIQCDVSSSESVSNMVKETINILVGLDILVNNAGITRDNLLMRMKENEWDDVINTNLKGVFLCTKVTEFITFVQRKTPFKLVWSSHPIFSFIHIKIYLWSSYSDNIQPAKMLYCFSSS